MTDRLAELHQGRVIAPFAPAMPVLDDIEAGRNAAQDAILVKFNQEADRIDQVYVWANNSIRDVVQSLKVTEPPHSTEKVFTDIEKKLDAVRKRLKRIAGENKELATAKTGPASLRIRVARYTKLGKDFMAVTAKLENAREAQKKDAAQWVKREILLANPDASETQIDRVIESGADVEVVLTNNTALAYQVDELRSRNKDIQGLSRNIVDLHQMFTDMSILVDGQQELINNIEYNVEEVKSDTKKAGEELVEARKHQKSARKKKMCIIILAICIVVAIALAIIIPIGSKNGWFSGGDDSNDSNGNGSSNAAPSPSPAPASSRRSISYGAAFHGREPVRAK